MRILQVNDTYYPNVDGSSYVTHRLATNFKRRGHDVLVIAPSQTDKTHYSIDNGVKCFRVFSVPLLFVDYRFSPPFFIKKKILKAINEFKPDVIHVHGHFMLGKAVIDLSKDLNLPIMGTNHFMPGNLIHYFPLPILIKNKIESLAWLHFSSIFKKLDYVVSPTQTGANVLKNVNFPKEVHPVSNGINLIKFNQIASSKVVKEKYGIQDKFTFLTVSRLDKDKRLDYVLRAMPIILEKHDAQLVIVGKGAEKQRLEKLSKELGVESNVVFTGFVSDDELPGIYTAADCFINAGPFELQGLAVMESMASGLPVIAVNSLALPELVHNGENGFLFEENDYQTIANSAIKIINDFELKKKMGAKSLEIISKHDINNTLDKYENMYNEIIKNKKNHTDVEEEEQKK